MRTLFTLVACLCALRIFAASSATLPIENQITPSEFKEKIAHGLRIVSGSQPFSVTDATMLVRLSNTLFLTDREMTKQEAELQKLMWGAEFTERLKMALGDAVPNRGMGNYFSKPDLHWGGSAGNIRERDRYQVVSKSKKEANQLPQPMPLKRHG